MLHWCAAQPAAAVTETPISIDTISWLCCAIEILRPRKRGVPIQHIPLLLDHRLSQAPTSLWVNIRIRFYCRPVLSASSCVFLSALAFWLLVLRHLAWFLIFISGAAFCQREEALPATPSSRLGPSFNCKSFGLKRVHLICNALPKTNYHWQDSQSLCIFQH